MTRIFLFPGQGSQKIGMGAGLFEEFPQLIEEADSILPFSIRDVCLNGSEEILTQTQFTQPAIFVVNALTALKAGTPDTAAGHSIGEYNALFTAGAMDWPTALKLVAKRGELMSQAQNGAMTAVLGVEPEKIREVLDESGLESVDIANFNSPGQTVISGLKEDIVRAGSALEAAGFRHCIPLKVGGAFHSRYMENAKKEFSVFIGQFEFKALSLSVIANATARPYEKSSIAERLAEQITSPVLWSQSMDYLLKQPDPEFEEMGVGNVLTGLLKQIRRAKK